MLRFRRALPLIALLVGSAIFLVSPPTAKATFSITVNEYTSAGVMVGSSLISATTTNATTFFTPPAGSSANYSVSVTGFQNTATSGLTGIAILDTGTITVRSLLASTNVLRVFVSISGFTSPIGPGTLTSSFVSTPGPGAITFQSFGDSLNNDFGATGSAMLSSGSPNPLVASAGAVSAGLQTPGLTGSVSFTTGPGAYSLTNVTTFSGLALGLAYSTDGRSSYAVPAPVALTLAFSGLSTLGMGQWIRRRRMAA